MYETDKGLPNTCSQCGTPQTITWFVENDDQARAGGGLCAACRTKQSDPLPEPRPRVDANDGLTPVEISEAARVLRSAHVPAETPPKKRAKRRPK
jgi:hypothetical protein